MSSPKRLVDCCVAVLSRHFFSVEEAEEYLRPPNVPAPLASLVLSRIGFFSTRRNQEYFNYEMLLLDHLSALQAMPRLEGNDFHMGDRKIRVVRLGVREPRIIQFVTLCRKTHGAVLLFDFNSERALNACHYELEHFLQFGRRLIVKYEDYSNDDADYFPTLFDRENICCREPLHHFKDRLYLNPQWFDYSRMQFYSEKITRPAWSKSHWECCNCC